MVLHQVFVNNKIVVVMFSPPSGRQSIPWQVQTASPIVALRNGRDKGPAGRLIMLPAVHLGLAVAKRKR